MTSEGTDRVPYITEREDIPTEHRHRYDELLESRGAVKGPFSVLMHSPEIAGRIGHLGEYLRFEGLLSGSVRELTILTVAWEFDCAFEWAYHEPIAREEGVSTEAIEVISSHGTLEELDDDEYIVPAFIRELLRENSVSGELYTNVLDRFGNAATVELTATVGYYAMLACILNAFEVMPGEDTPMS